jgi:hypothetical protein
MSGGAMHTNLFFSGSKREIYEALDRDLKRDIRHGQFWLATFVICLIVAATNGVNDGWPWLSASILLGANTLRWFIEASNRNFLMHAIDWIEANRQGEDS